MFHASRRRGAASGGGADLRGFEAERTLALQGHHPRPVHLIRQLAPPQVQGYLAHKKQPPPRTLRSPTCAGSRVRSASHTLFALRAFPFAQPRARHYALALQRCCAAPTCARGAGVAPTPAFTRVKWSGVQHPGTRFQIPGVEMSLADECGIIAGAHGVQGYLAYKNQPPPPLGPP